MNNKNDFKDNKSKKIDDFKDNKSKKIIVIDEFGKSYSSTYPKRANGLVKNNRAYWVDETTICLIRPQMEVKIMTEKDYKKLIALTVANNQAIRQNKGGLGAFYYDTAVLFAQTYDTIVERLRKANIKIPKGLLEVDYAKYANDTEGIKKLIQVVYCKDCLMNPFLKIENDYFQKNVELTQAEVAKKLIQTMIALIGANKWVYSSISQVGYSKDAILVLVDSYNDVVSELVDYDVEIPENLKAIDASKFSDDVDGAKRLLQTVSSRGTLLEPILKIEMTNFADNKKEKTKDESWSDNIRIYVNGAAADAKKHAKKSIEEAKETIRKFQEQVNNVFSKDMAKASKEVNDVEEEISDIAEDIEELEEEISDITEDIKDLEEELEEREGFFEELSEQIKERYAEIARLQEQLKNKFKK